MKIDFGNIPSLSGCYIYKDKNEKIIYIGKAKNLKKRVLSYFNKKDLDIKTKTLVSHINKIDFIVTNSEVEALILENNLIKKNSPKYNINLKDSKSYAFLELTHEEFPRLIIARSELIKKNKENKILFGPFTSALIRDQILQTLIKTFKLRTCKTLPKRKCLRYDLGICSAPCIKKISKTEYEKDVKKVESILKGKIDEILSDLKKEMKICSADKNFEQALILREKIFALEHLKERQTVEKQKKYDEDVINFIVENGIVYLTLFNVHKGILENKESFEFEYQGDFLNEFLIQYYSEKDIPKRIIIPKVVDPSIKDFLKLKKGSFVEIKVPKKGESKILLDLVKKNIEIQFFGNLEKLEELKKVLNLNDLPRTIECFDISHLSGTNVVASMIQFKNAKPNKSNYRKFKIKSFVGNDDFRAMNEVIKRRYLRLKEDNEIFPDLIVVDGGLGQLNAAINSLNEINVKIPIISLAKKFEEIYVPGNNIPLKLNEKNKARLLLESIRDEAHRFAVKFQRERRNKSFFD